MHYRIIQDPRDGLWRWTLIEAGRAIARSLDAFIDASSCRQALQRTFPDGHALQEWTHNSDGTPPARPGPAGAGAGSATSVEGQFEDVGLKRNDAPQASDGEAEPMPMPQIGR